MGIAYEVKAICVNTPTVDLFRKRSDNVPYVRLRANYQDRERPEFGDVQVYAGGGRNKPLDTQVEELQGLLAQVKAFRTILVRFTSSRRYWNEYTRQNGEKVEEECFQTNLDRMEFYSLAQRKWVATIQEANAGRADLPNPGERTQVVPAAQNVPTTLPAMAASTSVISDDALMAELAKRGLLNPRAPTANPAEAPF